LYEHDIVLRLDLPPAKAVTKLTQQREQVNYSSRQESMIAKTCKSHSSETTNVCSKEIEDASIGNDEETLKIDIHRHCLLKRLSKNCGKPKNIADIRALQSNHISDRDTPAHPSTSSEPATRNGSYTIRPLKHLGRASGVQRNHQHIPCQVDPQRLALLESAEVREGSLRMDGQRTNVLMWGITASTIIALICARGVA